MKRFVLFLILAGAQLATAQMYQGKLTIAEGVKAHLKNSPCDIYINSSNKSDADVTIHYGDDVGLGTPRFLMKRSSVFIGEKAAGYDYGFNMNQYDNESKTSHVWHYRLKVNDEMKTAKLTVFYRANNGNFFNKAPSYKLECEMKKTDHLQ